MPVNAARVVRVIDAAELAALVRPISCQSKALAPPPSQSKRCHTAFARLFDQWKHVKLSYTRLERSSLLTGWMEMRH